MQYVEPGRTRIQSFLFFNLCKYLMYHAACKVEFQPFKIERVQRFSWALGSKSCEQPHSFSLCTLVMNTSILIGLKRHLIAVISMSSKSR